MRLSANGLNILKGFEGFSATPYRDGGGYSIGYGHFIKPGESLTYVTEAQGAQLLAQDVSDAENTINNLVKASLTQNQFDALVSLTYNIGGGSEGFAGSTVLRQLNAGNYEAAKAAFAMWKYSNGAINNVLINRRAKEMQLFDVPGNYSTPGGSLFGEITPGTIAIGLALYLIFG